MANVVMAETRIIPPCSEVDLMAAYGVWGSHMYWNPHNLKRLL